MIHPTRSTGSPFVGMQFTNNLIQATWHRGVCTEQEIWIPVLPLFSHVTTCQSFCLVEILEILPDFIFTTVLYSCCNHLSPPTFANGKQAQKISEQAIVRVRPDPRLCADIFCTGIFILSSLTALNVTSGFIYKVSLYSSVSSQEVRIALGLSNRGNLIKGIGHTGD